MTETDPVFETLRLKKLRAVGSAENNSPVYRNMPSSSSPWGVCLSSQAWLSWSNASLIADDS
jgi:hypothetical protein